MSAGATAVLFDLDGTLVDTAPDLVDAVNRTRAALGHAPVPEAQVRPHVSRGGMAMLRAGIPEAGEPDQALLKRFLDLYLEHIFVRTALFPGMGDVLDEIEARGHRVLMKHWAQHIEVVDGKARAVVVQSPEGEKRFEAEHVISTMPVRSLVRALSPAVPDSVGKAAEGLRYRDFLVVALMLRKENLFPDNWIYIHTPGVKVGRIQNFNNWSQAMVPEPGMTCLGMEYFCFKGDGLWDSPDEALIAQASRELEELGLAKAADVVDGAFDR